MKNSPHLVLLLKADDQFQIIAGKERIDAFSGLVNPPKRQAYLVSKIFNIFSKPQKKRCVNNKKSSCFRQGEMKNCMIGFFLLPRLDLTRQFEF